MLPNKIMEKVKINIFAPLIPDKIAMVVMPIPEMPAESPSNPSIKLIALVIPNDP